MSTSLLSEKGRLGLLYRVSREISGRLDLSELLPRVLRETVNSAEATTGTVLVINPQGRVLYSALMMHGLLQPDPHKRLADMLDSGLAGWVLRHRQPAFIRNTMEDARWSRRPDDDVVGAKSVLAVPLPGRERLVGVLTLVKVPAHSFDADDLILLTAIAEQAGVAIENAQLYAESNRRERITRALADTARTINTTLKLDEVLNLVAYHAMNLLEVEAASVALIEEGRLVFKEAAGAQANKVKGLSIQLSEGIAGWVATHDQAVLVPDVRKDARFFSGVDTLTGYTTHAGACVPVKIQGQVIGVIEAINPVQEEFEPETLDLLGNLATLAATAIFHAQQMAELQAAESRFASLFEDNIDPILITDLNGVISNANRKAVETFGYSRTELVGLRITTVHRTGTAWLGSDRFRHLRGGQEITYTTRITTKNGREIPMEVHAKLIQRRGQEFIQWIQRDISAQLELEETRTDLINMIYHDLRSPLGNIVSSLDVVNTSLPPESELERSLIAIANRAALRLSRLVDSLLDMRRMEAGQLILNRDQTNLHTLALEAFDSVSANAEGKGIGLKNDVAPRLPLVHVDADMVRRVLINLVDNAIKYTPGEGMVTLAAKAGPEGVTLSVRDTGPGIPASEHSRIFSKFARLKREVAPKGLGLGLAFCKMAVEAHGGKIWVESQPGQGSTFFFTLPY